MSQHLAGEAIRISFVRAGAFHPEDGLPADAAASLVGELQPAKNTASAFQKWNVQQQIARFGQPETFHDHCIVGQTSGQGGVAAAGNLDGGKGNPVRVGRQEVGIHHRQVELARLREGVFRTVKQPVPVQGRDPIFAGNSSEDLGGVVGGD